MRTLLTVGLVAMLATPALAHHSFAMYDMTQTKSATGKLIRGNLRRVGGNAADTYVGNVRLLGILHNLSPQFSDAFLRRLRGTSAAPRKD